MQYYLIGIKGSAMSSLALFLNDQGHEVRGSDVEHFYPTEISLRVRQIPILSFNPTNIGDYTYIISPAYGEDNCEVQAVLAHNYQYYYYPKFIASLPGTKIAISGTHGKTTTTALVAHLLADCNTSYLIGSGEGVGRPNYQYLVYEACEYRDNFLNYHPDILLINNIEWDHPDYFASATAVQKSFKQLKSQAKQVIINCNSPIARQLADDSTITFGGSDTNLNIHNVVAKSDGFSCCLNYQGEDIPFSIPFFGQHMLENFAGSYIIARLLGVSNADIQAKLFTFQFPEKRMKEIPYGKGVLVVDYAHHPSEIKAVHDALKQKYPNYQINALFQPHTYTRTLALLTEFNQALALFDTTYIDDVFTSAREKLDKTLQAKIDDAFKVFPKWHFEVLKQIKREEQSVWVFLGAGEIDYYISFLQTFSNDC